MWSGCEIGGGLCGSSDPIVQDHPEDGPPVYSIGDNDLARSATSADDFKETDEMREAAARAVRARPLDLAPPRDLEGGEAEGASLESLVDELRDGIPVAKHARNGVRSERRLTLDADGAALSWHAAPGGADRAPRRSPFSLFAAPPPLPLAAVLEVRPATREDASKPGYMGTEVLRHNVDVRSAARCFSLITAERTIDFELPESEGAKVQTERLVRNLERLVEQAKASKNRDVD